MKNLFDRLLPLTYLTKQNRRNSNRNSNKLMARMFSFMKSENDDSAEGDQDRSSVGIEKDNLVLVSSSNDREVKAFDRLVHRMQSIAKTHNKVFAGALLRPHVGVIGPLLKNDDELDEVARAAYEAGQQLVQEGMIQPETLAIVRREISPQESHLTTDKRDFQQISA
jgi:hypothetical protein